MAARRDDRLAALGADEVEEAVGIIGAVAQNQQRQQAAQQVAGGGHVVLLARPEGKAHRQAQRIDYGVDLGSKAAAGAAKSLGLRPPLFWRLPAACA